MSRKMKGFFQHPFIVLTRTKSSKPLHTQQFTFQQQRQYLIKLKLEDINLKKSQLQEKNTTIQNLKQAILQSHANIQTQRDKLQAVLEQLRGEEKQKQIELENCQEIESIDPDEFKVWREEAAKVTHKLKMKGLKHEYEKIRQKKNKELQDLREQLDEIKNQQKELTLKLEMLKGEEPQLAKEGTPPQSQQQQIPDTDKILHQIVELKQKIQDLEETNINLINIVKQELDSSTWGVKQKFQQSKDRIQKQMKRLYNYLQKPNKQVIRKVQNPDKIAQPITLIEDYQSRLHKIEQSLPSQLRQERILKCLRPLSWKLIKGVSFQPNGNNAVHDKFQKLKMEFTEAEELNKQYRNILNKKQTQIETLKDKIQQYQQKIQQIRQQL